MMMNCDVVPSLLKSSACLGLLLATAAAPIEGSAGYDTNPAAESVPVTTVTSVFYFGCQRCVNVWDGSSYTHY